MVRLGAEVAVVLVWLAAAAYCSAAFYLRWPLTGLVWLGAGCGFYSIMWLNLSRIVKELR